MLKILSFILCIDYIFILCLSQVKKSGFHPSRKHVGFSPQIYNLFLNGYDVPSELDGQKIAFSESELTPDLLTNLAENNVRSVKVMSDKSIAAGYMDYLHKQKKDNKF